MFERFILATDLSPAASAVVACAAGLRSLGARHCLLLQCLDLQQAVSTAYSYSTAPLDTVLAEQEDYGLIVVGSHGYSMAAEALLGGVATEVIHSARKPVLVVRLRRRAEGDEICLQPAGCDLGGRLLCHRVVRHAPAPVLLIPAAGAAG